MRPQFNSWVRKIPWMDRLHSLSIRGLFQWPRKYRFCLQCGETWIQSLRLGSPTSALSGYVTMGSQELDMTEETMHSTVQYTLYDIIYSLYIRYNT